MSLIVSEVYDALVAAGAPDDKAKAAAGAIPMVETLATRQDLAEFKADTRQDFAEFKAELRQEMAEFKAELKQEMAELRAELKDEIGALKREFAVMKLAVFTFGPTIVALLVKLVFFP